MTKVTRGANRRGSDYAETGRSSVRGAAADGRTYGKCVGSAARPRTIHAWASRPGSTTPGSPSEGMDLLAHLNKPDAFFDPANPGNFGFLNSDMAFQGDNAFVGNFNGFNIYDISNPAAPTLTTSVVCPGGQGDLSVYKHLLFMSVEETRAKKDCTLTPGGRRDDALPRRPHLRHQQPRDAGAGRPGPDLPRLAHAHARHRQAQQEERLHLRAGHGGRRGRRTELAGCDANNTNDADRRQPVEVADRGHQGPAGRARGRRDRQRAAAVRAIPPPARSTASRTPRRRRSTRPAWRGARRRSRTPATTSPCIRSSRSRRAPARATAC